jgi:hypothetical protein
MLCLCDYRTPKDIIESLRKRGFETLLIPADYSLPTPVNGHTDLNVFVCEGTVTLRSDYYEKHKELIDKICESAGLFPKLSEARAGDRYPLDCGLCAAVSGKSLLYCAKATDALLVSRFSDAGYQLIEIPQGYAKCSCAILSDGAIITADKGIAKVTRAEGIDTLLISPGHVDLPGYSYGFIGGATGLCGDTLYFCGDLDLHPDSKVITEFAQKHGTKCVSLGKSKLYDVGSLIFI